MSAADDRGGQIGSYVDKYQGLRGSGRVISQQCCNSVGFGAKRTQGPGFLAGERIGVPDVRHDHGPALLDARGTAHHKTAVSISSQQCTEQGKESEQ
jgi:hypothetical protein